MENKIGFRSVLVMPPKGVSKAVSKRCPECKKQIPVATRHCQCGHQFFEERRRSTASNTSEQEEVVEETNTNLHDIKELKAVRVYNMESHRTSTPQQAGSSSSPAIEVKRRSERVKREKPNFYDSLEYDNQMRKARKERQKEEQLHTTGRVKRERKIKNSSELDDDEDEEPFKEKRKRKKKKSTNGDKKEEEIDEDILAGITPEKEWQFSMILSDINMKFGLNNPRFVNL